MSSRASVGGWLAPEELSAAPHAGVRTASAGALYDLPPALELGGMPPVYDQGQVGSCTAEASAAAVEILLPRAGYAAERPDRAALYRRARDAYGGGVADAGASLADTITALRRGWEKEAREPSLVWGDDWTREAPSRSTDAPRIVNAEALDFDVPTIAWELAQGHPVAVGLRITAQWEGLPPRTMIEAPAGDVVGGHAVVLVGYSQSASAWRVRNSWGEGWGDRGYAWLPWSWTRAPWCGEVFAVRAVRRAA